VEDRLEILSLLSGAAFSADVASVSYWEGMFTDDAILDRGGEAGQDQGKAAIVGIIASPNQRAAIDQGMAHLATLPHISVDGDRATATGYLLAIVKNAEAPNVSLAGKGNASPLSIYHLTVNTWLLERAKTGWAVTSRTLRPIGSAESLEMLEHAISG
jgi:hypothetical protein